METRDQIWNLKYRAAVTKIPKQGGPTQKTSGDVRKFNKSLSFDYKGIYYMQSSSPKENSITTKIQW